MERYLYKEAGMGWAVEDRKSADGIRWQRNETQRR